MFFSFFSSDGGGLIYFPLMLFLCNCGWFFKMIFVANLVGFLWVLVVVMVADC